MTLLIDAVIFAAVAVALFTIVGYANAFLSGWLALARRYPDRTDIVPNARVSRQTIRFWPVNEYWNTTIGADQRGLYLHVGDFGHRPLCIPWHAVEPRGPVKPWFFRTWESYLLGSRKLIGFPANSRGARLVADAIERYAVEVRHP